MKCKHSDLEKQMFLDKLSTLCSDCVMELINEGKYEHWEDIYEDVPPGHALRKDWKPKSTDKLLWKKP